MQTAPDYAYLAGLIDGDGCISISTWNHASHVCLSVPTKSHNHAVLLKEEYGGTVNQKYVEGTRYYTWLISSNLVAETLTSIFPFLQYKAFSAMMALCTFYDRTDIPKVSRTIYNPVRETEWCKRSAYANLVHRLGAHHRSLKPYNPQSQFQGSKEEALHYIAGFVDAEGSFSIIRANREKDHGRTLKYTPFIFVGNDIRAILDWIRTIIGVGAVSGGGRTRQNGKTSYQLILGTRNAYTLCRLVFPHLRLKQFQAMIMMAYCRDTERTRYCQGQVPIHELAKREGYRQLMQKCNA